MFVRRFPLWDENDGDNQGSGGTDSKYDSLKAEIDRLKGHNSKLLDEKKTVQAQLKKFEGLDPDNIKKMMHAFDSNEEARLMAEGKIDEVVAKRTEKKLLKLEEKIGVLSDQLGESDKEKKRYKDEYDGLVINTEIRRQAEKAGVIPAAIDDVIFRSKGMFSLDEDGNIESRDSNGNIRTVKKKPLDPGLFIEQLKDSAPHFWPASKGAGASGKFVNGEGMEANPFMEGTPAFNRTKQAQMLNREPDKAQRMKAVAEANKQSAKH